MKLGEYSYPSLLVFTPRGNQVLYADGNYVNYWDLGSGGISNRLAGHMGSVVSLAISSDGKRVITTSGGHEELKWWDIGSGRELRSMRIAGCRRFGTITPDGRLLLFAYHDDLVVSDPETGSDLFKLEGRHADVTALTVTRDSKYAVTGSEAGTVRVWDLASRAIRHTFEGHVGRIWAVAATPDSNWAFSLAGDDIRRWRLGNTA